LLAAISNFYTQAPYIGAMSKNRLTNALWRALGGVFGVAVLISMAFALNRLVTVTGLTLT